MVPNEKEGVSTLFKNEIQLDPRATKTSRRTKFFIVKPSIKQPKIVQLKPLWFLNLKNHREKQIRCRLTSNECHKKSSYAYLQRWFSPGSICINFVYLCWWFYLQCFFQEQCPGTLKRKVHSICYLASSQLFQGRIWWGVTPQLI